MKIKALSNRTVPIKIVEFYVRVPLDGQNWGTCIDQMTLKGQIQKGPREPFYMSHSIEAHRMLELGEIYFKNFPSN